MFQFWIFGVVISTITANAIFIDDAGCVGKCQLSKGYNKVQYLRHKDCDKHCTCVSGIPIVHQCDKFGEHWSESQELCTDPEMAKCHTLKEEYNSTIRMSTDINSESETQCDNGSCGCIGQCPELEHPSHAVSLAHQDCTKYCHCRNGRPVVKNCTLNYQFNLKNMMCLRQEKARCDRINAYTTAVAPLSDEAIKKGCKTKCPKYYNALITHEKCSRYCQCTGGSVVVKFCPKNRYFNVEYATCIPRYQSTCKDSAKNVTLITSWISSVAPLTSLPSNVKLPTEPMPSLPTESLTSLPTGSEIFLQTEPISGTENMLVEDVSDCIGTCPGVDSDRYLFYTKKPHKNCEKYCECHKGNFTVKECSFNNHFDVSFKMCILPTIASCYKNSDAFLSTPSATSTILPIIDPTVLPTEPIAISVTEFLDVTDECIKIFYENYLLNNETVVKIPHQDCNKYCEYHQEILKVMECPENSLFDWQFSICDRTDFARCYSTEHGLLSATKNPLLPVRSSSFLSFSLTKRSPIDHKNDGKEIEVLAGELENIDDCIGKCFIPDHETYEISLPHKYCGKYCECEQGIPIVKSCSSNLHFNQYLNICDQPEIAGCQGIRDTNTLKFPSVLSAEPSTELIELADGINGCIGECLPSVYLSLQKPPNFLPHKRCAKYCKCEQGKLTVKLCPADKYFSPSTKRCVHSKLSGCTNIAGFSPSVTDLSTEEYTVGPTFSADASPHETSLPIEDEVFSTSNPLIVLSSVDPLEPSTISNTIVNADNHPQKGFLNILITLKMDAVKNGSEIDVFLVDPNDSIAIDNDSITVQVMKSIVNEGVDNDIDSKERHDLVTVLANLEDREKCVGICRESDDPTSIYLPHYDCKKTCKCSYGVLSVMECRNQLYWDSVKQKCDLLFNVKCHQVHQRSIPEDFKDAPSIFDELKSFFDKLGPSSTKLNHDKKR